MLVLNQSEKRMLRQTLYGHRDPGGHPSFAKAIALPGFLHARGASRIALARRLVRRRLLRYEGIPLSCDGGRMFSLTDRGTTAARALRRRQR